LGYARALLVWLGLWLVAMAAWAGGATGFPSIGLPSEGQFYHGVYPGGVTGQEDDITLADLRSYEALAGKTAVWVYFSHNWYRDRHFPLATATWIRQAGSIPFIRLMLWDKPIQNRANRLFTLKRILAGNFDEDFRAWARAARDFGAPLIVEYGTEVNGRWFPWNGKWNGGNTKKGYGDRTLPDGPERFKDAYRHIINLMRQEGANNITWVFHVNCADDPDRPWNHFENYYPGDDYIDWLGVSVYGAQTPKEKGWPLFRNRMDLVYPRLAALAADKPIFVLEFGATLNNPRGNQAAWAEAALTDLIQGRWPRVKGFSWWNEAWKNDHKPAHDTTMRLQDNPALAEVFHRWVGADHDVLGSAIINP